jgi:hypothetical protein
VSAEEREKPPVSPITVTITLNAEDWDYVQRRLNELAQEAETRTPVCFGMWGGGAGGSYSVTTSTRDISPVDYRRELDDWFQRIRKAGAA